MSEFFWGMLVSMILALFECVCVFVLFDTFFVRRLKHAVWNRALSAMLVLWLSVYSFGISYFFREYNTFFGEAIKALLIIVMFILVCAGYFFHSFPWTLILAPVTYFLITLSDHILLAVIDLIGGGINTLFSMENPSIRTAVAISLKIVLFIFIMIIRSICKRLKLGRYRQESIKTSPLWFLFVFMPLLSLASVMSIINVAEPEQYSNPAIIAVSIGWLLMTLIMFFLLQIYDDKQSQQEEARLSRQQAISELESLHTVKQVKEDYHDYQHHLIWIETLLSEGKYEQAKEYIRSSPYTNIVTLPCIQTDNDIMDAVLNQKYWKAKGKSICIVPVMSNIPKLPIDDHDLVAVLANLLDNAIEACEKVTVDRVIQLKILINNGNLIISVRNPVSEEPIITDGSIVTSKEDGEHHGLGLRSVQRSLERYDASYGYECKSHYFQYSAVIPLQTTL